MFDARDEFLAYANHLAVQHRRLERRVGDMQDTWASILELAGVQRDARRAGLVGDLSAFYEELDRHFVEEEQGACLEEAVSRRPALASVVKSLEAEHGQLLDQLQGIILQLQQDVAGGNLAPLAGQFQQFVHALHAHEAAESDVLERGFNLSLKEA